MWPTERAARIRAGLSPATSSSTPRTGAGIKLGPGGVTGGAVNVAVRFNTIYNSSQNVSLSRDTSNVVLERNILVKARESNITAFRLRGRGNVARDNLGYDAPRFIERTGAPGSLIDGGGNLRTTRPRFDSIGCRGFRTQPVRPYGARGYASRCKRPAALSAPRNPGILGPARGRKEVSGWRTGWRSTQWHLRRRSHAARSRSATHLVDHPLFTLDAIAELADRLPPESVRRERGDLPLVNPRRLRGRGRRSAVGDDPRRRAQRVPDHPARHPAGSRLRRADRRVPGRGRGDPAAARGRHAAPHGLPLHHGTRFEHARCTSTPSTASCSRSGA